MLSLCVAWCEFEDYEHERFAAQGGAPTAPAPSSMGLRFSFYCGIVAALRSARRMLPLLRGLSGV